MKTLWEDYEIPYSHTVMPIGMRPSKSVSDLELKSVKKKYKNVNFAAGCSREVIERGAAMLGWTLDELISKTILAMRSCEDIYEKF